MILIPVNDTRESRLILKSLPRKLYSNSVKSQFFRRVSYP